MQDPTSTQGQAPPTHPSDAEREIAARKTFFAVDNSIHQLTGIHLVFHSLVLVALVRLAVSAQGLSACLLVSVLAFLGFLSTWISIFRELRSAKLRDWWEKPYHDIFIVMRDSLPYCCVKQSRAILLGFLLFFYVGVGLFPWLNLPKS